MKYETLTATQAIGGADLPNRYYVVVQESGDAVVVTSDYATAEKIRDVLNATMPRRIGSLGKPQPYIEREKK